MPDSQFSEAFYGGSTTKRHRRAHWKDVIDRDDRGGCHLQCRGALHEQNQSRQSLKSTKSCEPETDSLLLPHRLMTMRLWRPSPIFWSLKAALRPVSSSCGTITSSCSPGKSCTIASINRQCTVRPTKGNSYMLYRDCRLWLSDIACAMRHDIKGHILYPRSRQKILGIIRAVLL